MNCNITLTMIKPEAVEAGNTGAILSKIEEAGFKILSIKKTQLSQERAMKFYEIHKEKPFYQELVEYMSGGPIIACILEKENAVMDFRDLIGSTNPQEAKEGTIRKEFAESLSKNAIHGSDSDENAILESNFHFSKEEIF